ncbi:hypothetical protein NDO75_11865 [Natrinema sp. 1APR25-10V2]|nr:hypothetical protein [Natrinema sp. 1APR25-10V2]
MTVSTEINESTAGNATFQFTNASGATATTTIADNGSDDLDNTSGNITAEIALTELGVAFADNTTVTVAVDEGQTYAASDGTDSFQIDDTAPTATIDAPNDGALTNASTIEYTATDDTSVDAATLTISRNNGTEYYNGSAWVTGETTIDVTGSTSYDISEFGVNTYTVTLDVTDTAGNTNSDTITFERDAATPANVTLDLRDVADVTVKSEDNLDIVYEYIEDNTQTVTVTLEGQTYRAAGQSYTYVIDDEGYISSASKSVTLDLDEQAETTPYELADGAYSVTIEAEDAAGNTNSTTTAGAPVVVDDRWPEVTGVSLNATDDVAPSDTVDVTYDYADATNATELTLILDEVNTDYTPEGWITQQVDHNSGTDLTQTFDLSNADIDDNAEYNVYLIAEDSVAWTYDGFESAGTLDVNADAPQIDSVEANAGEDTVTVSFTEPIGVQLDRTDLAYQDVSGDGAAAIDRVVHEKGASTAILTLDTPVSAADLGTDLINARSGEIPDTADHDPRYVDSGVTVALQDTTAPTVTPADVTATTINQATEDTYSVAVDLDNEVVDVEATVSDSATETSGSVSNQQHAATVTDLNVSDLNDSDTITVTVTVTDKGGNVDTATTTVEKDTVSPSVESVQANAGTDDIYVTFDEEMSYLGANDFDLNGVDATIQYVDQVEHEDNTYRVDLYSAVSFNEINTSDATIAATTATDAAGNPAEGTATQLNDNDNPHLAGLDASANNANVTVEFSEGVVNASGQALDADDFVYTNANDGGASGIESVDHTAGATSAVVTLNATVTANDLGTDELGIAADAVYDANESVAPAMNRTLEDWMAPDVDLEATTDGETITYTVTSNEELDAIDVSVDTENDLAMESEIAETLTAEDFELQSSDGGYVYTANYTAPRDGQYNANLLTATDLAGNDGAAWEYATTEVDTAAPSAVDAIVDQWGNDRVGVIFDEPIDANAVDSDAVTVEGASVEHVDQWYSDGESGIVVVDLAEPLQTGDEPNVTVTGDSFQEITNDSSAGQTTPVTVHTMKLDLNKGTNFVSVPAISGGQDLSEVDTSNVDVIWSYTGESWEKYDPDDPESDFTSLEGGQGYIIEMKKADTLDINVHNLPASSTGDVDGALMNQQQLDEGWNLVGHYQTEPQPVYHALSSISEDVHVVYGQSAGYEYELVDSLSAGDSYWVFVTDDTVYTHAPSDLVREPILTES